VLRILLEGLLDLLAHLVATKPIAEELGRHGSTQGGQMPVGVFAIELWLLL